MAVQIQIFDGGGVGGGDLVVDDLFLRTPIA